MKKLILILLLAFGMNAVAQEKQDYTYTISWCINYEVQDPCPDANRVDEFGRRILYGCLVFHSHIETECGKEKQFTNRKDAFEFYNRAIRDKIITGLLISDNSLSNVEIDSSLRLIFEDVVDTISTTGGWITPKSTGDTILTLESVDIWHGNTLRIPEDDTSMVYGVYLYEGGSCEWKYVYQITTYPRLGYIGIGSNDYYDTNWNKMQAPLVSADTSFVKILKHSEMKKLFTLEGNNDYVFSRPAFGEPQLNGIACPECGAELYDSNPSMVLTSNPPQLNTHCSKCKYTGYRFF